MKFPPSPPRPELDRLLKRAKLQYDAMTPKQRREMQDAQRKSWVIGEMMLEHPEMTRAQAEELYETVKAADPRDIQS